MLALDDPRWKTLNGGYRIPYDASDVLRQLEAGEDVWDELWDELHHQGDVGEASYAAVPHLVRIASAATQVDRNLYSLLATIEIERHRPQNPPLPTWCQESYAKAWEEVLELALKDVRTAEEESGIQTLLGVIAVARGQLKLGTLLSYSESSELDEFVEERYGKHAQD
ncbi:hypothetical protein [Myxococcus sp. Y35]|uniref:hypothetical protein n=1 Tax=Pseudomyxococcus flavus TaxID=3115648 RepID=UPI003CF31B40